MQYLPKIRQIDARQAGRFQITSNERRSTAAAASNFQYLGQWQTPWWEDGVDKGPKTLAGFLAETTINRHDFGVSWNSTLDRGGVVVGNTVEITIDAEAIRTD